MAVARVNFRRSVGKIRTIQRCFRRHKMFKLIMKARQRQKEESAFLLQRQLKGYLVYQKYYSHVKGKITNQNLDYIITRYADAKEFMRECLQVQLAYLTRKMIKRKRYEEEQRRLAEIEE